MFIFARQYSSLRLLPILLDFLSLCAHMEETIILQELENLVEDLGIEIRYDDFEGRGGLCRYGGKICLIVNRALSSSERIHLLAAALARFPLDDVFIRPQVRELLAGARVARKMC